MRAVDLEIYIDGNKIEKLFIESFEMIKNVNDHGELKLVASIASGAEKCMSYALANSFAEIKAVEENRSTRTIFTGIVYNIEVICDYHEPKIILEMKSGTYVLDTVERTRTFQASGTTYQQLFTFINQKENAKCKFRRGGSEAIHNMKVQYKETDWKFLVRMASVLKQSVLCDYTRTGVWYYIGLDQNQSGGEMDYDSYSMRKMVNDINKRKNRGLSELSDKDAFCYVVRSREIYEIGQAVTFKGDKMYIYQVKSYWNKEEVINEYLLRTENAFLQPKQYQEKLIGASMNGRVNKIAKDQVSVTLDVDAGNGLCGSRMFPYSTVYSSNTGTGWYCMPEEGDSIRLYFPTADEKDAYVLSSVHLDASKTSKNQRNDPDTKSIRSIHDKEIIFAKEKLVITNNDGMEIVMDDIEGITIDSNKNVSIKAKNNIDITGENEILIKADTKLEIEQGNAKIIEEEDKINIKGGLLKLQD